MIFKELKRARVNSGLDVTYQFTAEEKEYAVVTFHFKRDVNLKRVEEYINILNEEISRKDTLYDDKILNKIMQRIMVLREDPEITVDVLLTRLR